MMRACWTLTILITTAAVPAFSQSPALRKPFLGKTPPELVAKDDDWLAGPPVSLQKFRGKVVWLQFNF